MDRCKNLAKIVRLLGGIDALHYDKSYVENGSSYLTISLAGVGPSGGDARILEVEYIEPQRVGCARVRTLAFEVLPTDNRRSGWRTGLWVPLSYRIARKAAGELTRVRTFDADNIAPARLRSLARSWDYWAEDSGFLDEAEYAAALKDFDRRWSARLLLRAERREQADRDRAALQTDRARESAPALARIA